MIVIGVEENDDNKASYTLKDLKNADILNSDNLTNEILNADYECRFFT